MTTTTRTKLTLPMIHNVHGREFKMTREGRKFMGYVDGRWVWSDRNWNNTEALDYWQWWITTNLKRLAP